MLASVGFLAAGTAQASFLSGDALDAAANGLSWFILIVMPPAVIGLFWMVHVLPQKAAEKRHHPQKEAIHVLCLLSLVFGGLLWPLAWLWAYTRPSIVGDVDRHGKARRLFRRTRRSGGSAASCRSIAIVCHPRRTRRSRGRGFLSEDLRRLRDRLKRAEQRHAQRRSRSGRGAA